MKSDHYLYFSLVLEVTTLSFWIQHKEFLPWNLLLPLFKTMELLLAIRVETSSILQKEHASILPFLGAWCSEATFALAILCLVCALHIKNAPSVPVVIGMEMWTRSWLGRIHRKDLLLWKHSVSQPLFVSLGPLLLLSHMILFWPVQSAWELHYYHMKTKFDTTAICGLQIYHEV